MTARELAGAVSALLAAAGLVCLVAVDQPITIRLGTLLALILTSSALSLRVVLDRWSVDR